MRLLVTGTRDTFSDMNLEVRKLIWELRLEYYSSLTVVHGGCLTGVDHTAQIVCDEIGIDVECWPGHWFKTNKDRNQHMVNLGADLCAAFATKWASGTGQTARMARKAGLTTIDYGVSTE